MVLQKSKISLMLLVFALLTDTFISNEIGFLMVLLLFVTIFKAVKINHVSFCMILILMYAVLLGLYKHEFNKVIKDVWYILKPLLFYFSGAMFWLKYKNKYKIKVYILYVCLIYLFLFIQPIIFSIGDFFILSADDFRDKYGKGSILFVIGCALSLDFYIKTKKMTYLCLILFFIFGTVIAQSRFLLLFSLIYIFIHLFKSKSIHRYTYIGVIFCISFMTLPTQNTEFTKNGRESFFEKIIFSLSEVRPQNYLLDTDIHQHWRGYETYMAMNLFLGSNPHEVLFGSGLGQAVPIDFAKRGGVGEQSDIRLFELEWLHNGYVTILLKTGVLGITLLLYIFYNLVVFFMNNKTKNYNSILYMSLVYYLIISTFLLGGVVSKSGILIPLFLLGYLREELSEI